MPRITIDKNRCKACLLCIRFCPKGSIVLGKDLNALGIKPVKYKENKKCIGCAMCAIICPDCCIEVKK